MTTDDTYHDTPAPGINAGVLFRAYLTLWLRRYGILMVMPVVAFIFLGIAVNLAWVIVAFLTVCILWPMAVAMLFFYYMLTPQAARALLPMHIDIAPDGTLHITYTDGDRPDETIPATQVSAIRRYGTRTLVTLRTRPVSILLSDNITYL